MTTGQSPRKRGQALEPLEKLAMKGLVTEQRSIEREYADLQQRSAQLANDHDELLEKIEERLALPGALIGDPPTHEVDRGSWNVVEITWAKPDPPEANAQTTKIRTHADADALAAELGLTFPEDATVAEKKKLIEQSRSGS